MRRYQVAAPTASMVSIVASVALTSPFNQAPNAEAGSFKRPVPSGILAPCPSSLVRPEVQGTSIAGISAMDGEGSVLAADSLEDCRPMLHYSVSLSLEHAVTGQGRDDRGFVRTC